MVYKNVCRGVSKTEREIREFVIPMFKILISSVIIGIKNWQMTRDISSTSVITSKWLQFVTILRDIASQCLPSLLTLININVPWQAPTLPHLCRSRLRAIMCASTSWVYFLGGLEDSSWQTGGGNWWEWRTLGMADRFRLIGTWRHDLPIMSSWSYP